jgi:hypothetical protein
MILWKEKVHPCVHKSPPLDHIFTRWYKSSLILVWPSHLCLCLPEWQLTFCCSEQTFIWLDVFYYYCVDNQKVNVIFNYIFIIFTSSEWNVFFFTEEGMFKFTSIKCQHLNTVLTEIKKCNTKYLRKLGNHTNALAVNLVDNSETTYRLKKIHCSNFTRQDWVKPQYKN